MDADAKTWPSSRVSASMPSFFKTTTEVASGPSEPAKRPPAGWRVVPQSEARSGAGMTERAGARISCIQAR